MGAVMRDRRGRSRAAVRLLAGLMLTVCAIPGSADTRTRGAALRVAFVNQADLPGLSCRECRELGRLQDGVWLLAPDAVILSGKARLLYFSQADYESAIRQLSATETARVMRRRADQWSQTAIHDAADYLYRRQKECLCLGFP